MFYYLAAVERSFYQRIIKVAVFFLFLGLLIGLGAGYKWKALDTKYEHERMQQQVAEKKEKIADLESALGIKQGKPKLKVHGHERKIP
jgi:hypothetical protein